MTSSTTPELLWQPSPARIAESRMAAFRAWLRTERDLDLSDYRALWEWSVADLEGFWGALADFFDVAYHDRPQRVLAEEVMPGARWFPGATLNYAEQALRGGAGKADDDLAVIFAREDGRGEEITFGELRARVAAARAGLVELGVERGDRVAALAPNSPETLVAFLAAASLGATWSSCSPDFGLRAVADRFVQIEPKVLIAVNGYVYGGRSFDVRSTVDELREAIPGSPATVLVDYLGNGADLPGCVGWDDLLERHRGAELAFDAVPFDHPLWVLYSSGTTGLPKGIVHGHGGMTLEHLKAVGLHCDLGPGDRFFWFTTTGWMMWNFLVGGLLTGTTIVLFDGSPAHPDLSALWRLAERYRVNYFGTSAPYIQTCLKRELRPKEDYDLSALRTVGSTGAPLTTDGFRWIADAVGEDVQIASISGGTDMCTAFVGASPDEPVYLGEISCRMLGAAVAAYDEHGRELHEEVGELVVTKPMPTMPVFFWNDPDGSRLRDAYFDTYPGVWRHGDWVRITDRDTLVIYGRSDSTLNRGGIRMGTAEFYRVVEGFDEVTDSLVIDTSGAGETDGELLCFLVLAEGVALEDVQPKLKEALRGQLSPRHVPNRFIVVGEIPHTLNGKKLEVPVKKILAGADPERAVSRDALQNPDALTPFVQISRHSGA
ncbi:acetoacetyl-CoA synthetase [Saccharopolyspora erythraea NRRL 2338]|uniref:Acetoacetyl-CoA synthetase n=2 Tax=Saccharopolyspora erythraea TaxID=1836 RepID=A4F697_SACEN|nr:acetoacetate--CoA ligase [Saccharopolyspora erythraea]EQD88055.1 acetoacetyl-CoA synthetase [Saccharopolyspora erythraea D]PFG93373.1 acetoacetyl-CoA synthetase [Saccharopolyspora erythraea NRRL 2338]QRK90208.1 acetoacetate--CoA ligase [Saccharopolyspora erythraea]CAL99571.1 acetoacetyl-CoA synthetase [Saccharopolyspora erythraea NRRL 2338]